MLKSSNILSTEYTLEQLILLADTKTPTSICIAWMTATTHEQRLNLIERAIDWIAQSFTTTRQNRQDRSEDAITQDIVQSLESMGIDATHDTQFGGHADIAVRGRDEFLWIAEAKIHRDYAWLLQGFEQLDKRYTTGLPGQDAGEMIIYHYRENTRQVMASWIDHLAEKRPDVTIEQESSDPLARRTRHIHNGSGLEFKIRHKAISLYFNREAVSK